MKQASRKLTIRKILFYTLVIVLTFVIVVPFLWMLLLSFKSDNEIVNMPLSWPESLRFDNYARAFEVLDFPLMYRNTFIVVVCTQIFSLLFTFMSSFAISRMTFKNGRTPDRFYLYFLLGLAVPVYILIFPIYRMNIIFDTLDTYLGLIIPYIALSVSFNTLLFVGFLRGFPKEIEEAAVMDGCGLYRLCLTVVAPIMKSVFVTVTIFNVIYVWNEFPLAVTFISDTSKYTISLMASMFKGKYSIDYSGIDAASVMIIIPQLVFYAIFQKYIISGMTEGAVKG